MSMLALPEARLSLASLAIFRGLLQDPLLAAFRRLCAAQQILAQVEAYGEFSALLMAQGNNWSQYLLRRVLGDDNFYVRQIAGGQAVEQSVEEVMRSELGILQAVGRLSSHHVAAQINCGLFLPAWQTSQLDFHAAYARYMDNIAQTGYGIFHDYHIFSLAEKGLVPVKHPDKVQLSQLTGYQEERRQVMRNTVALLEGRPAANILLYGDSGTGKSTTVKAVANELKERGLRLVEVRKDQLRHIPRLIERLMLNPLKFILFIDDLSFTQNNEHFSSLKAILEGSVFAKSANMVIYATSNRRHLVRERFSDREGDEIHVRDTIEELSSLSERFGLVITFLRPGRDLYWSIVQEYFIRFGLPFDDAARRKAETFALERGGRSARVARQFAEKWAANG